MSKSEVSRFRSAYSGRLRVPQVSEGVSLTKQAFKAECDINVIMRSFERNGILPNGRDPALMRYLDCTAFDFQAANLLVSNARMAFFDLPAEVRDRFQNDPALLLSFLADDRNRDEAVRLGLVKAAEKALEPVKVELVSGELSGAGVSPGKPLAGS